MTQREEPEFTFPRDKDELLRDFTVASRLRDIREAVDLRQALAPKWWEALVGILQFAASLGLLAALIQHPQVREDSYLRLIVFWGVLALLSLVLGFEFLILKLYHLRRAHSIHSNSLVDLECRLSELEKRERLRMQQDAGDDPQERQH